MMWRVLSISGFLLLVSAYLINQTGRCRADGWRYLGVNAIGAGLLAAYSWVIDEFVFVALEGFWSVASLWQLVRLRFAKAAEARTQ